MLHCTPGMGGGTLSVLATPTRGWAHVGARQSHGVDHLGVPEDTAQKGGRV